MKAILFIIIPIFIFTIIFLNYQSNEKIKSQELIIDELKTFVNNDTVNRLTLNQKNVLFWIKTFEIEHDTIVLKQSIQESGHQYSSTRARQENSLFGFQNSDVRKKKYAHWIVSIYEYKRWQSKYYNNQKHKSYYDFLASHKYSEDSLYIIKLRHVHTDI